MRVVIKRSDRVGKKYVAIFDGKRKTHFGASGYEDYTQHKDDTRKASYLSRHRSRENWNNPESAGALSRWILWNKKSFRESVRDYKNRFGFN
jgi:hypothetical protein